MYVRRYVLYVTLSCIARSHGVLGSKIQEQSLRFHGTGRSIVNDASSVVLFVLHCCTCILSSPKHNWIRTNYCNRSSSFVHRRSSHVVRQHFHLNIFFSGMVPGWSPTYVVERVLIDCISRSRGQKKRS